MHTLTLVRAPGSAGDKHLVGELERISKKDPSGHGPGYVLRNARTLRHVDDDDHLDHIAKAGPNMITPLGKQALERFLPTVLEAISCTPDGWAHLYDFQNGTWRQC